MQYSNLGYALLGRIIANVSGQPYRISFSGVIFTPLGMASTGYDVAASPAERRALGYRWEDDAWKLEPTMAHGAFGAMGGMQTSADDYAKWVAFLLSAWPPRDGAELGRCAAPACASWRRARISRSCGGVPARAARTACRQAATYAMGFIAAVDCDLGLTLSHGGGYPGYGSHVLLLPDYGVGVFAFANRTYAGPRPPVWDAAVTLFRAGQMTPRPLPVIDVADHRLRRGRRDLHDRLDHGRRRRARHEYPDGSRRRALGPRFRRAESRRRRTLRHRRADRAGHARSRAVSSGPANMAASRLASARAHARASHPGPRPVAGGAVRHGRPARAAVAAVAGLLCASAAAAHPAPFSFLDLRLDAGRVAGTLIVHDLDAAHDWVARRPWRCSIRDGCSYTRRPGRPPRRGWA